MPSPSLGWPIPCPQVALPVITGGDKRLGKRENIVAAEGDWTCVKVVMGCILDKEAGIVITPERKIE